MPATYEKIATTTLGSSSASITLNSIPATYTDLRLIVVGTASTTSSLCFRLNGDSGTNYSRTFLYGTGSVAGSGVGTNNDLMNTGDINNTTPCLSQVDIFSYAGSTFKTFLTNNSADLNGSGLVAPMVGLWRSTSAITSIAIFASSGNLNTNTTATLYGILKA